MTSEELYINIGYTAGMQDAWETVIKASESISQSPEVLIYHQKLSKLMFASNIKQQKRCKELLNKNSTNTTNK